ncbi:secondary thiamine-phosphate synthase enzyme YjbQ [Desulfobulbus sp. F4]|nr:secondary thiamine-phosphate synthase enzyme YjbQ [Desulfobulbus sp. F3]MCW5200999.1 secondary thiamine-phosphate synthase enzyme YjbQ [Desulfobulbus sp. F4]
MYSGFFPVSTNSGMEFVDITEPAQKVVNAAEIAEGLLCLYCPHTTAGLTINEGCDPAVLQDMRGLFRKMIPHSYPCRHAEGNSPAHALATLTGSSVMLIIAKGQLRLGTWQHIFFCEYDGPKSRKIFWKVLAG